MMAPIREILIIIGYSLFTEFKLFITRIIPYPPNFRRIAARIIDPAMGASTWAFGSHR